MNDQAEQLGRTVLASLAEGRAAAAAFWRTYADQNEREIRRALDLDILAGHPEWGRASRIARAVRGKVRVYVRGDVRDWISERGVRKILERLSGRADLPRLNAHTATTPE